MIMRIALAAALSGVGLIFPAEAPAQGHAELAAARSAGQIGERFDGYLGFAAPSSPQARRQAGDINIRRRALYADLATRRRVTPQDVGIATGCELLKRVAVGEAYMLPDGVWRRRASGTAVPLPDYCG